VRASEIAKQLTEGEKCRLVALHDRLDTRQGDGDPLGDDLYRALQAISERLEPVEEEEDGGQRTEDREEEEEIAN
jgi:hypothetical protein